MSISQRITDLINIKKLSTIYIAEQIGASDGSIRNYKSGRKEPSLDFLLFLRKEYPNLNYNWLLLGEDKMFLEEKSVSDKSDRKRIAELESEQKVLKELVLRIDKKLSSVVESIEGVEGVILKEIE